MTYLADNGRGIAFASLAAIAFGTTAILAKLGYREGADLVPLLATRFAIAGMVLAAYNLVRRRSPWVGRRNVVRLLLLGGVGFALESSLFFLGLERAPAGVVSLIFYTYPMWTALFGFATRLEPYRHRTLVALLLGTAGVSLIFSIRLGSLVGPLFALLAAIAVAIYFLVAQIVIADVHPSVAAAWTAVGAAVSFGCATLLTRDALPPGAVDEATALGFVTALAFVLLYESIVLIGSARAAVASMLEPVATLVLAALVLDEVVSSRVVLGAALVVSALPVLALAKPPEEPAPLAGP
ncbi:MAG: DMT family transporter [Actinomycetota bacterium]|nr:DMT family transporter [Actinomycetota bacterium]